MPRNKLTIAWIGLFLLQPCLAFAANKYSLAFEYGHANYYTDFISSSNYDDGRTYNLSFGYHYSKYVTAEIYYADLGKQAVTGNAGDSFTHNGTTTTFTANNSEFTYKYKALGANVLLKPRPDASPFYFKIGVIYWKDDYYLSSAGVTSDTGSASGFAPLVGIGYKFPITPDFSLRVDSDLTKIDNNVLVLANFGVSVSF